MDRGIPLLRPMLDKDMVALHDHVAAHYGKVWDRLQFDVLGLTCILAYKLASFTFIHSCGLTFEPLWNEFGFH